MRTMIAVATVAVFLGGGAAASPPSVSLLFDTPPGASLPVVRTHEYVMSGAVRPLLFWMGRDDIGIGRIVWRADAAGSRGYELLVGTDPAKAPRAINRWGLISEESGAGGGSLLALMTGSHETSYETEAAGSSAGAGDFRLIRSQSDGRTATWQLARLRTPDALTVHQAVDALAYVRRDGGSRQEFRRSLPPNVRPGFLSAVAEMLNQTIARAASSSGAVTADRLQYVFGSHTYELRLRDVRRVTVPYGGQAVTAVRTRFEARALDTGTSSSFELTSATSGELAGVPLLIEWQPRWWLKVRLQLATPRPLRL